MRLGIREFFFLVLALAVIGGTYFFVFVPTTIERRILRADIRLKKKALADLALADAAARELNAKAERLRVSLQQFTSTLPSQKQADQIVKDLSQTAESDHLDLKSFDTQPAESLPGFARQTVQMKVAGDCTNIYQFLQQLEAEQRHLRVAQMSLHRGDSEGKVVGELKIFLYYAPAGIESTLSASTDQREMQ
jgi:Tfp pilus assembly protein PilO